MDEQIRSANPLSISTLKTRRQFLALRTCEQKVISRFFIIQYANIKEYASFLPSDAEKPQCYIGYTVTKKMGNAVARNRIKRRLREMVRAQFPLHAKAGFAYNIIARHAIINAPFESISHELQRALHKIHH